MADDDKKATSDRSEADETLPPTSDFLRMLECYAADLRLIVQKLRERFH
jgi:hypothetical protein